MNRRLAGFLSVLMLATAMASGPVRADEPAKVKADAMVWSGIFLGTDRESVLGSAPAGAHAKSVVERLGRVEATRFAHYRVLGEQVQPLLKEYDSWVVPSRGLFFRLDSRGPAEGGGLRVAMQLWRDKEVLLKTDIVLQGDRPVLVRGPALGDEGVLLLALRLAGE